ncbi:hypothetical protein PC110_g10227 [Phytophthora cactorum]|uniref:Uncharacterized protein n=1 Tax=Phytophthora cactorum TaxID=29920 RepID=A0A329S9J6_9STRA|nr:hypothetical protein PC110_g10227 [Phytophthora cactorum]
MALRSSRLRCFLLLTATALLIAFAVGAASAEEQGKVSVEITESEPDTIGVTVPEFVATNDWQELLPGQGVPRGLHVRLNLETGKREAKLVDPNEAETEESMRSVVVEPNAKETTVTVSTDISGDIDAEENENDMLTVTDEISEDTEKVTTEDIESIVKEEDEAPPAEPNWNHEKIYDVLQALPEPPKVEGMDIHEAHEKMSPAEFRKQIVTLWKKRQAELKEALESLQDDAKYLGKLLEQFKEAEEKGDAEGQLSVLEVLEWEVQDLDKTHVFNFIGGFGIVAEYLNSTNLPVRASAAWVVGSAAKNYKDGQEWAIDAGVIPKLVDSLKLDIPSTEEAAKDVLEVKKKAIYALSSLVRSNERGQRLFSLHNGPELLAGLLNDAHPAKLQLKVLLFVYDLLAEATEIKLRGGEDPAPFALIELEKVFQSEEWCQRFSTTFVKMAHLLAHREVIELVDAMQHQLPTCQKVHQASGVKTVVERLAKGFADDEELDAEEKKELALFFEDFLGHQSERTPLQSDRSSKMRGTSTKAAPEPLGVLRGHGAPVNSVGFLSVSTVVSGAGDGAVKIWDLKSRRELATNPAAHSKAGVLHTAALQGAAASEHKYVTQGRDGFVKLWDAQTFGIAAEPLSKLYCGSYSFTKSSTMRWPGDTPEGAHVIVCPSSVDNKLLVYDIREDSSSPALTLTVPDAAAKRGMCVSLSLFGSSVAQVEDGAGGNVQTYIAAGFEGGQLAILDLRSGGKVACETTVTQGANALLSFDVTRDGRSAICGSSGEELYVANIDVASYTLSSRSFFSCAHGGFSNVCIRGDQRIVATAGWDHRVRVFHLRKLKPLAVLKYHSDSVFALDFSADSALLASCSKDHKIALWSIYPPSPAASANALQPY